MNTNAPPFKAAIVGLGFGAEFIPIYQRHPSVELTAVCRRDSEGLNEVADRFEIPGRYTDYRELLADSSIDLVHINSPIQDHGWMSIEALRAGKHVLCTVPMATSINECETICGLVEETGLTYMMAETVVYSREYLFLKQMHDRGEFGQIQYLQASHPQDMDGWPDYWQRMVPMHYATHVVSPVLGIIDGRAETVSCVGSGRVREEIAKSSGSPFAVESAHIKVVGSDVVAHVWRCLYDTSRQYRESFDVYGSKRSFEWSLVEGGTHLIHTAGKPEPEIPEPVEIPDFAHLLPEEIQPFTRSIIDADHLSFLQGAGHGGSHPHLVHAFVSAVAGECAPYPNAATSANWTCVGLLAHESAMLGGESIMLPAFTRTAGRKPHGAEPMSSPHINKSPSHSTSRSMA